MEEPTHRSDWGLLEEVWKEFVALNPCLGYRSDRWTVHNFLRHGRDRLRKADAIRYARNRQLIAHRERFLDVAFAIATGQVEV